MLATHYPMLTALAVGLGALLPSSGSYESPSLTADDLRMDNGRALLLIDGTPLDVLAGAGHAGPLVMDLDGEGPADLLVGDLRGSLHVFLGRKIEGEIRYESKGALQSNGEDIRVHNW